MCYCSVLWLHSAGEADHSRRLLSLLPELHLHPGLVAIQRVGFVALCSLWALKWPVFAPWSLRQQWRAPALHLHSFAEAVRTPALVEAGPLAAAAAASVACLC